MPIRIVIRPARPGCGAGSEAPGRYVMGPDGSILGAIAPSFDPEPGPRLSAWLGQMRAMMIEGDPALGRFPLLCRGCYSKLSGRAEQRSDFVVCRRCDLCNSATELAIIDTEPPMGADRPLAPLEYADAEAWDDAKARQAMGQKIDASDTAPA